jgi:hypothetical protein
MPSRTTPPADKQEPHLLLRGDYYIQWAIPASLASQILPHLKRIKADGYGSDRTYTLESDSIEIEMLSGDKVTAMLVANRMTKPAE